MIKQGVEMGSPLSPIMDDILMEAFEKHVVVAASYKLCMYKGYFSDTFLIWLFKN